MSDKCIISFANGNSNYLKGLARLGESLRHNFDGDFMGFVGENSLGAPSHKLNPYAFKVYAFKKAIEQGYKKILWLDTSCFAIRNVQPIFDEIEKDGFIFQDARHFLGTWTNDFTLNYFDINRDDAMDIRMIGNAGFLGLNIDNSMAREFILTWEQSMLKGCFKGNWTNKGNLESEDERCRGHRHDMSCSSAIVHKMRLSSLMKNAEEWLQYAGVFDQTLNESIIIKAQGL